MAAAENEGDEEGLSDLEIKERTRKRDGYKCRDCGMTQEQHKEKYGSSLEVHRVIPGLSYQCDYYLVTLCIPCHGRKPKRIKEAFFGDIDTEWLVFNTYDPDDAKLMGWLKSYAEIAGYKGDWCRAASVLLRRAMEDFAIRERVDDAMQADGLW